MILALDIGNSRLSGGFFQTDGTLLASFYREGTGDLSSQELTRHFKSVLASQGILKDSVESIGCSSVVSPLKEPLVQACRSLFQKEVLFLDPVQEGSIQNGYKDPSQLGSDRYAGALAAHHRYPGKNVIVADLGTATTLDVLNSRGEFLGGAIFAGVQSHLKALHNGTSNLPLVEPAKPAKICGDNTQGNIQSGVYYSQLGALREFIVRLSAECFQGEPVTRIATGGYAGLFEDSGLFDFHIPDLILEGIFHYTNAHGRKK